MDVDPFQAEPADSLVTREFSSAAEHVAARITRRPLIATYLLALGVRLALLAWTGPLGGMDTSGYRAAADALRQSVLTQSDAFLGLPPILPVYMALIPNATIAVSVQIAIVAAIAPLMVAASRRHFGPAAGLAAGIIVAVEPTFVFWSTYLLTDSFGLLFFAIAIERTSLTVAQGQLHASLVAGAAMGAAWITRAAYALPAVVLAGSALVVGRRREVRVAAFGLGLLMVLAVPATRNLLSIGEPILYRDQGWQLLWSGTMWNEIGRGTGGVDIVFPAGFDEMTRPEQNQFFRDETIEYFRSDQRRAAGQMLKKLFWFWAPTYPEWSFAHKAFSGTYFTGLYTLALAGVVLTARSSFTRLLLACLAGITIMIMLTIVDYDGRYRMPAELCIVPLAGATVARLLARRHHDPPSPLQ